MRIFSTKKLDSAEVGEPPKYMISIPDNPYLGRVDSGVSIQEDVLRVADVLVEEFNVVYSSNVVKREIEHGLHFVPTILGAYYFKREENYRVLGDYPARLGIADGFLWVDDVTSETVTIGYQITDDLGPSSPDNDDIVLKLYLLENESI